MMGRGSRSSCQRECVNCHKGVVSGGVGKGFLARENTEVGKRYVEGMAS